jgi:hypothetical protein
MRSRSAIRDEVARELANSGQAPSARQIELEADRRFHLERLIEEAEEYERQYGDVRIEFMAAPDDEYCRRCRELNGRSITLEHLKRHGHKYACRCGLVLPPDTE